MFAYLKQFEKFLIKILMLFMAIVLAIATIDLVVTVVRDVAKPPFFFIDIDDLLDIFGLFMLVLIGIELLETIMKTYLTQSQPHYEVVLSVALIAIARKIIILDLKQVDSLSLLGIAAIVLCLAAGYYLMRRSHVLPDTPRIVGAQVEDETTLSVGKTTFFCPPHT